MERPARAPCSGQWICLRWMRFGSWWCRVCGVVCLRLEEATGTSTLFSLWWPFPADEVKELNMTHLADAKYGALVRDTQ